jgi:hypothetical protein
MDSTWESGVHLGKISRQGLNYCSKMFFVTNIIRQGLNFANTYNQIPCGIKEKNKRCATLFKCGTSKRLRDDFLSQSSSSYKSQKSQFKDKEMK